MKKLITTIIVMAIIFTMCGTAMAAGETVTVGIKIGTIDTEAQTASVSVNATYTGTESLTLLKVQLDSEYPITSISSDYSYTYNPHNGLVLISCYQTSGTAANPTLTGQGDGTVLFTINYTLSSATANGSYPIDITVLEARNHEKAIMPVTAVDGSLEVGTMLLGDINASGTITNSDLVLLSRYLSDLIDFTAEQLARADMNGDGQVTNADMVLLSRLLTES